MPPLRHFPPRGGELGGLSRSLIALEVVATFTSGESATREAGNDSGGPSRGCSSRLRHALFTRTTTTQSSLKRSGSREVRRDPAALRTLLTSTFIDNCSVRTSGYLALRSLLPTTTSSLRASLITRSAATLHAALEQTRERGNLWAVRQVQLGAVTRCRSLLAQLPPSRPFMTRLLRSLGFILALTTAGLGLGRVRLELQRSRRGAVGGLHAVAARLGAVHSAGTHGAGDGGQRRRPRRMAGRRRGLDQQHGGIQSLQHVPHDRRHRCTVTWFDVSERIPGICQLGRRLRGDSGHAFSAQYVGDHRCPSGREHHPACRFSRRGGSKCMVHALA